MPEIEALVERIHLANDATWTRIREALGAADPNQAAQIVMADQGGADIVAAIVAQ